MNNAGDNQEEKEKLVRTLAAHRLHTKVRLGKREEDEVQSNCLAVLRKINRMLRLKIKNKIRMNGEGLTCLEGLDNFDRALIMMMILICM